MVLPDSSSVDTTKLAGAFQHTTNSYKFLWLMAILSKLENTHFEQARFSYEELVREMLIFAWYPSQYHKLSLGYSDQLSNHLSALEVNLPERISLPYLRSSFSQTDDSLVTNQLTRYVPYRFLSPWFKGKTDSEIQELSNVEPERNDQLPIYAIDDAHVILKAPWVKYIQKNFAVIQGWLNWHWAGYLQKRNQAIPNIVSKLLPPDSRTSLTKLRTLWRGFLAATEMNCIYSGLHVEASSFTLDHYVPWAFVAHDEPWNTVPVPRNPNINSVKSNNLPAPIYLEKFVETQINFVQFYSTRFRGEKRNNFITPYAEGLNLTESQLTESAVIESALLHQVRSQLEGAKRLGFTADWQY